MNFSFDKKTAANSANSVVTMLEKQEGKSLKRVIGIGIPDAVQSSVVLAYPEYSWRFAPKKQLLGFNGYFKHIFNGRKERQPFTFEAEDQDIVVWCGDISNNDLGWLDELGSRKEVSLLYPGLFDRPENKSDNLNIGVTGFLMFSLVDGLEAAIEQSNAVSCDDTKPERKRDVWFSFPHKLDADKSVDDWKASIFAFGDEKLLALVCEQNPLSRVYGFLQAGVTFAARVKLAQKGVLLLSNPGAINVAISNCHKIITDNINIAAIATMKYKNVKLLRSDRLCVAPFKQALANGATQIGGVYRDLARYIQLDPPRLITSRQARDAFERAIGNQSDDIAFTQMGPSRINSFIVVGKPKHVTPVPADLFGHFGAIQVDDGVSPKEIAANKELSQGLGVLIWFDEPDAAKWIDTFSDSVCRILHRYPCDFPFSISHGPSFFPALNFERVVRDGDTGALRYDLAADIDLLSETQRRTYFEEGVKLLPLLKRMQSKWRLRRFNIFEMARKFGSHTISKVLVLGQQTSKGLAIETNSLRLTDEEIVRAALEDCPESLVIYKPTEHKQRDKAFLNRIKQIDPRVRLAEYSLGLGEMAHVVDEMHTIDSQLGIPALMTGLPLKVYGSPSYAGLGVTDDIDIKGGKRKPGVQMPINLETFIGWYFSNATVFADPITGKAISPEKYCTDWAPYLGELKDSMADRLVKLANKNNKSNVWMRQLRVLQGHAKKAHVEQLVNEMPLRAAIKERYEIALGIATALAEQGEWKHAVEISKDVLAHHGESKLEAVTKAIVDIRASIKTIQAKKEFATFLLATFRIVPSKAIIAIADNLRAKNFFGSALVLYSSIHTNKECLAKMIRCFIGLGEYGKAQETIATLIAEGEKAEVVETLQIDLYQASNRWLDAVEILKAHLQKKPVDVNLIYRTANAFSQAGRYDKAIELLLRLVRSVKGPAATRDLAGIYLAKMQPEAARGLLEPQVKRLLTDNTAMRLLADCYAFENELEKACEYYFLTLSLNPFYTMAYVRLREIERELDDQGKAPQVWWSDLFRQMVASVDQHSVDTLLGEGRAALLDNDLDTIIKNAKQAMKLFPGDLRAYGWYAHGLAWQPGSRTPQEIKLIEEHYHMSVSRGAEDGWFSTYDYIRSLSYLGDRPGIRHFLREYQTMIFKSHKHLMGGVRFAAGIALGDVEVSLESYKFTQRSNIISKHARKFRYETTIDKIQPGEKVLFLSEGGVGDEIRYATIYPELAERYPDAVFSVDERLLSLFQRSFPEIKRFIPLPRYHRKRMNVDLMETIGDLPDQSLAQLVDNVVWQAANEADVLVAVPCTLLDIRENLSDFNAGPTRLLQPDPQKIAYWQDKLKPYRDKLIVGIIWTSMIDEYMRIVNYLTLDDMASVFTIPDTVFINLQYEDSTEAIAGVKERYGVDILDFPELDKKDDFDGVAAFSKATDMVLGVNTATIELTGFTGCETIYIAPTPQHSWRKYHGGERDVFFPNMHVIQPDPMNDRNSMMERIVEIVTKRAQNKVSR